ncbi:MAG: SusC/RagA family TonB-linked outer membrane protein, partial [Myxococcota bacterium]
TREAVPGATVIVQGSDAGAISEEDGSFTITGVPVGEVVLEISSPSHQAKEVTVGADQNSLRITLSLAQAEEIVVTGRAPEIFRKNLANGAAVVRSEALNEVPSATLTDALQGKVTGANIQANSGAPGGGVQMRLRGISTIQGNSSPLYVVDGVLVSDAAIPNAINNVTNSGGGSNGSNQDNAVNRIADLNPNDIESIEILKGAAAAALYGTKAAGGVVIITTKRGRIGAPKVSVSQRFGTAQISNKFGSRTWDSVDEILESPYCGGAASLDECPIGGLVIVDSDGTPRNFDHEAQLTDNTFASETNASVSGGTKETKYLFSVSAKDEPGIIRGSGYEKQTARLAIDQDFGDRFKFSISTNVIRSDTARGLTNNDNAGVSHYLVLAATPSFLDLRPFENGTYPDNPFVPSTTNPLQTVELMEESEEVWRAIVAASGNLSIYKDEMHTVNLTGNLGIDRFQQRSDLLFPREIFFEATSSLPGTLLNSTAESRNINYGFNLIHSFTPSSAKWKAVTTASYFYDERLLNINRVIASGLTAGQPQTDAATSVETPQSESQTKTQSFLLQEEVLLLDDRLTLLAAVLADRNSTNGENVVNDFSFFPKASATYRIPIEDAVPQLGLLRARLAYGEVGNPAGFGFRDTLLGTGNIGSVGGGQAGGVLTPVGAGDPDLKPERQREVEGGFDVTAFEGRAVLEITGYQKNVSQLFLTAEIHESSGFNSLRSNLARFRNRGLELLVQVTPVRTQQFSWLSRTTFTLNRNEVTDLSDVGAFNQGGFGEVLGSYRFEVGDSGTQIIGPYQTSDNDFIAFGNGEPDFRVGFVNKFTFGDFTLHTLFDWQQGSDVINLTKLLYDFAAITPDYDERMVTTDFDGDGMADTDANDEIIEVPLGEARVNDWLINGNIRPYLEDASFLKLREISLTYELPKPILKQIGFMSDARVKVSGRNLITITGYSGVDPEVSNFGSQNFARNVDVAPYPPSRSYWLSLEAGF